MPCHFFRESSYWWSMLRARSRDVDGHNSWEVGMPTRSRRLLRGCGSGSGVYPFLEAGRRRPSEKKCRTANNNGSAAEDEAAARDCRAAPRAMSMQKDPIQAPRIGRCKDMEIIDDAESICRRVRAAGHQRPKPS